MYFCTCQQPFFQGGMMEQMQGGMMNPTPGMQFLPTTPMTPTLAMGPHPQAPQMGMMNQAVGAVDEGGQLPLERSFIENILRLNRGKEATVYMSFDGADGSSDPREFRGIIEAAGRDHIVLSDPETGERYLLLMVYLNYVKFDEEIEYSYPIGQLVTYPPR